MLELEISISFVLAYSTKEKVVAKVSFLRIKIVNIFVKVLFGFSF